MKLIERAKQDAKEKIREKKAKERAKRERGRAEFEQLTKRAAEFVSRKLDMEIAPEQLRHQEQTWLDGDVAWDLTIENMEFEVAQKHLSSAFTLHLLPDPDSDGEGPLYPPSR